MTTIHFPEEKEFEFVESYIVIDKITCDRKPFGTISAEDYFQYAKTALARGDAPSLLDAMGNAKRCLDYQVKRLLYRYGLLNVPSNHFPARAQLLADLNIIPNNLLETFNDVRNAMEHDYTTPSKKDVNGAIDLCDLLFLATTLSVYHIQTIIATIIGDQNQSLLYTTIRSWLPIALKHWCPSWNSVFVSRYPSGASGI